MRRLLQRLRELLCRHDVLRWRAGIDKWEGECVGCGKCYSGKVLAQVALGVDPTEGYDS